MDTLSDKTRIGKKYENTLGEFNSDNIQQFQELISLCKNYGCEIIVVSTPISDRMLWKSKDLDIFKNKIDEICDNANVPFYDFDLLKVRGQIINDQNSFKDDAHMSTEGASAFSQAFCDCMKKINAGLPASEFFYSSYEEAKSVSPYMEYYKAHFND